VDQAGAIDVGRALRYLEEIEAGLENLYSWYAELFSEDREAGAIFNLMRSEEKSHKNMVVFQRRLVFREGKSFGPADVDFKGIKATLADIKKAGKTRDPPPLNQAVIQSIAFEFSAAESYHRSVLPQANPSLAALIKTLTKENLGHWQRLVEFAVKRGWMEQQSELEKNMNKKQKDQGG